MKNNIIYKIKNRYRNVFLLFLDLINKPQKVLQPQYFESKFSKGSLMQSIIFPLSLLSACVSFVTYFFYSENAVIQDGVLIAMFNFLKLYVTAYLAVFVLAVILKAFFNRSISKSKSEMVVCSMMMVNFAVNILESFMPFLFFIKFIFIYQLYISWVAAGTIIEVDEDKHNVFMVLFTVVMFVLPLLIAALFGLLVPNLNGL
ncbi:MAG: hypothetical protein R3Y59_07575 [bacterium]